MSQNKNSFLPDVIEPLSNAIHQNIPETEHQTDNALASVVGFFNNVVLYPVKKANLTFQYKLEAFEDDLKEKVKDIPSENLQIPPTMIIGPALEALRYTYDESELREMYENLLSSSMDTRKVSQTHPSFVEAIRQMSPLDAKVMAAIVEYTQLKCAVIKFVLIDGSKVYHKAMPDYFAPDLVSLGDPFEISTSLNNLTRLGLITIKLGGIVGENYKTIVEHPYVVERNNIFQAFGRDFHINVERRTIAINDYGKCFAQVCLGEEI